MEAYLERIDCERPLYADVVHKKVDEAFDDAPELVKRMKDSRKKNSQIVTLGLWPLDVVSYNDWRQSTHAPKIYSEWVAMARIEILIVDEYRASMFEECDAAAFIRLGLAQALTEACKPKQWEE